MSMNVGIRSVINMSILFITLLAVSAGIAFDALAADSGARHLYIRANGLPASYAPLKNPLEVNQENIAAGAAIYRQVCKSCHGEAGKGDGDDGFYFNPKPSDLTLWANANMTSPKGILSSDQYLFWVISEGEAGLFETGMPAFKSQLSETERWQLVLHIRQSL